MGDKYNGIMLSDFLVAYKKIESKKQKCLPHLLRILDRLQLSCQDDKQSEEFRQGLKEIVKQIIYLFKNRKSILKYIDHRADIIAQCKKLLSQELSHKKAERLRKRLQKNHQEELYKCLFHPSSDFNNNFVERMLRPNVIMRKLTFGNRSDKGIENHAVITSLLQTAKLNNRHPQNIFYRILTKPKEVTLANLIRAPA
ncbi:MAG: transposase [bacterium]